MKPSEGIEVLQKWMGCYNAFPEDSQCSGVCENCEYNVPAEQMYDAINLAISALKELDTDKSCETCKYESYSFEESRCCRCFRGTDYEDLYEPWGES